MTGYPGLHRALSERLQAWVLPQGSVVAVRVAHTDTTPPLIKPSYRLRWNPSARAQSAGSFLADGTKERTGTQVKMTFDALEAASHRPWKVARKQNAWPVHSHRLSSSGTLSRMGHQAHIELVPLKSSLVNLPISLYGPLLRRQIVGHKPYLPCHLRSSLSSAYNTSPPTSPSSAPPRA